MRVPEFSYVAAQVAEPSTSYFQQTNSAINGRGGCRGSVQTRRTCSVRSEKPSATTLATLFSIGFALGGCIAQCYGQAPLIVTQPVSQEVSSGVPVAMNVEASGSEPFSYQWFKNGLFLQGSNQQSLVIASAAPTTTGTYTVRVMNRSGMAISQMARVNVNGLSASTVPIALTGWNQDVILENSPVPLATADFDTLGAYWFEAGLGGHADGLPASLHFTSQFDTNVLFQLQSYEGNNVLRLQGPREAKTQGTLTLVTPGPYQSLAILASCGGESGNQAGLVLSFSDGTVVSNLTYVAHDWSTGPPANLAITGLGRYQPLQGATIYQNEGRGFGMYETDIDLAALGVEKKLLASLTFTKANDSLVTGIFAVSGQPNKLPQLKLQLLRGQQAELTVSGFPQTSYRVDTSQDLIHWTPLVALASLDGISRFTNTAAGQIGTSFYRVVLP